MRKSITWILSILAGAALFVVLVFTCFEGVAFNEDRYHRAQEQYGIEAITGMNQDDLRRVTHELLLYCRGERQTLDMTATINGEAREVFGEREKIHMVDVQRLFLIGYRARGIAIILFLLAGMALFSIVRGQLAKALARGWIAVIAVLGVLLGALGIYLAIDFTRAFTQFHLLLFTNDLWLLDPRYEVLIQMLPEEFFMSLAQGIVTWSLAAVAFTTALASGILWYDKRRTQREPAL